MLFRQFYIDDNLQVGIWRTTESENELITALGTGPMPDLPHAPSRRLEKLATRVLAKEMNQGDALDIRYDIRRPFLEDRRSISISHSGEWVALALASPETPVGIDIEKRGGRAEKLAERFMNDTEFERFQRLPYDLRADFATLIWSAKEAIFKTLPDGRSDFRHDIATDDFELEAMGTFDATDTDNHSIRRYELKYMMHSQFILTISLALQP